MQLEFYSLQKVQAHIENKDNVQKLPSGHIGEFGDYLKTNFFHPSGSNISRNGLQTTCE